jgi:hypothetical protein
LELYRFECESGDGEETEDNTGKIFGSKLRKIFIFLNLILDEEIQPRIKQGVSCISFILA